MSARTASVIRNCLLALSVAAGLLIPAPSFAQVTPLDTLPTRNVGVLRTGDQLRVRVFGEEALSGDFVIDSRGYVQIPGVGAVRAAGLDPRAVHDTIVEQLVRVGVRNPSISVQPLLRVGVLGEVRETGMQAVEPGITLIELLSLAGGPTERADLEHAYVIRDGRKWNVDMEGALAGSATGGVTLFSNDVLVIPRRTGWTRENISFFLSAATVVLGIANVILASR